MAFGPSLHPSLDYPNRSKDTVEADQHSRVVMVFTLLNKANSEQVLVHQVRREGGVVDGSCLGRWWSKSNSNALSAYEQMSKHLPKSRAKSWCPISSILCLQTEVMIYSTKMSKLIWLLYIYLPSRHLSAWPREHRRYFMWQQLTARTSINLIWTWQKPLVTLDNSQGPMIW